MLMNALVHLLTIHSLYTDSIIYSLPVTAKIKYHIGDFAVETLNGIKRFECKSKRLLGPSSVNVWIEKVKKISVC